MKMKEETTTKDRKIALQLKKLLGRKENQDLGDKSRWENIPVNYIVTANTLGIELNDSALKRLNQSENKDEAFYSILIAQHFSTAAEKTGKKDLAEKLRLMVEDERISTQEFGIYALKEIQEGMTEEELKRCLENAQDVGDRADAKVKGISLESRLEAKNTVEIVLLPKNLRGECEVYVEYSFTKGRNAMENTAVNVYSLGLKEDSSVSSALGLASTKIQEIEDKKKIKINNLIGKGLFKEESLDDGLAIITAGGFEAMLFCLPAMIFSFPSGFLGGLAAGSISPDYMPLGVVAGAAAPFAIAVTLPLRMFASPAFQALRKEKNKNIARKLKDYDAEKVNWVKSNDLEEIFSKAVKDGEFETKPFEYGIVKRAIDRTFCLANTDSEDRLWGRLIASDSKLKIQSSDLLFAYREKLNAHEAYEKKKEESKKSVSVSIKGIV
ncbi:MAG: hypothetical protein ABIB71_07875 [Candidatus Woesearchaeota archaeon]